MTEPPAAAVVSAVLAAPARLGGVRVLAIDGPSGAGKTTFARAVVAEFGRRGRRVTLIGTDEFATWDEPVAWWPRLRDGVLRELAVGRPGGYRRTEWPQGVPRLGASVVVAVPDVLVLEGVSAGRASVRPSLSHLCWVDEPDPAARLERAVERDGEASRERLSGWQAFERGWFAVDETPLHAHTSFGAVQLGYFD